MNINDVIECLKGAPRIGRETDDPEGSRYIQISDTLAQHLIVALQNTPVFPTPGAGIVHRPAIAPKPSQADIQKETCTCATDAYSLTAGCPLHGLINAPPATN